MGPVQKDASVPDYSHKVKEVMVHGVCVWMAGFYLEKYFWGGSVLQCNDSSSLLQKYTLCRGSGGVSPRKFSDFEVTFDAI